MRLIDADELKDWIAGWFEMNKYYHPYSKSNNIPTTELYDLLDRIPTIDPVRLCGDCEAQIETYPVHEIKPEDISVANYIDHLIRESLNWYEKRAKELGYKGCRNCKHQIDVLRTCEWGERGGDGVVHLICPRWEWRERENG